MMNARSKSEVNQITGSIDKLLHYIIPYTKKDVTISVDIRSADPYCKTFKTPSRINVSPTLYTRLDNCHGAGNCCRVPFDLVYTDYDRSRIERYGEADHRRSIKEYGNDSAVRFLRNRDDLLANLLPMMCWVSYGHVTEVTTLWARCHTETNLMSGLASCSYLFIGDDRYFCGVHPFKPMHCWYPHMTVRISDREDGSSPSISIGRMQYGRNHKFGCPVIFRQVAASEEEVLFDVGGGANYFESQFESDIEKLSWAGKSGQSMGLKSQDNSVIDLADLFRKKEPDMRSALSNGKAEQITLWRNDGHLNS